MILKEVKQLCLKCKGTGTSSKQATDRDGKVIFAPPYYSSSDQNRPSYENCAVCEGTGFTLQPLPTTIMQDGEKVQLTPEEARTRYAMNS